MKIGTFGTGNMARAIAGNLARCGHQVMFGSREAAKAASVAHEVGHAARGGTNDDAAAFAEVVLHTVRQVPSSFLRSVAPLAGKIVVDLNNRDFPRRIDVEPLFPSLFALNRADLPGAEVVKCFNTMAMEVFDHAPEALREFGVSAPMAGGSAAARQTVAALARELGLHPVDFGGPENADIVEMQADFIRTVMFHQRKFLLTTQVREIPPAQVALTGGRRSGTY